MTMRLELLRLDYKQSTSDNDTKRTDIEIAQLYDGNQQNNEVKNV